MPPVAELYHFILLPVETALRLEVCPEQIVPGVAVTGKGAPGVTFTITLAVLAVTEQPWLSVTLAV